MSFAPLNIDDVQFLTENLYWFAPVGLFCILFLHYTLLPVLLTFQFPRILQAHAGKTPKSLIPVCVLPVGARHLCFNPSANPGNLKHIINN